MGIPFISKYKYNPITVLPKFLLVLFCLYQFYPLLSGVCMWRDCSIQLNSVHAMSLGQWPYRDFLFPHSPVSLLWPLVFVKLLGLNTFSFILAQALANILILLSAYAAARHYTRFAEASAGTEALLCGLWPFVLHAVFLNKMVLPFYNSDWLLWLMAALLGHSLLMSGSKRRSVEILFYMASVLAVLSNPRNAGLFAGLLWLHRGFSNREWLKPLLSACICMILLWLHRQASSIPDWPALLQRSDGYYAAYRLSDPQQLKLLLHRVMDNMWARRVPLILLVGMAAWPWLMQRKWPPLSGILLFALTGLLYVLSTALYLTDHYPNFDYRALCVWPAMLLMVHAPGSWFQCLLFSMVLLWTFEMPRPWQGKKDYCLSHIAESNLLHFNHYSIKAPVYFPPTRRSGFTFLADSTELAYKKSLQPYTGSGAFMHLTQPQYPHYLNGQSIQGKGLPLWFDYRLSTNDDVFQRVCTLIQTDSVRYLQLDRFSIHFAGHHFARNVIDALGADTGYKVILELAKPMPPAMRGDSTFIYRIDAIGNLK